MYSYIIGTVTDIQSEFVVIENNDIGYKIYTPNPYDFKREEVKVYLYEYTREDDHRLYGFKSLDEENLFLKLISVKGVGAKMALPMLATGTPDMLINAIENEDINYLKKFPKIGEKVARQIILDLKGKLVSSDSVNKENYNELISALEALGYKKKEINKVCNEINSTDSIDKQIKEALKLLLK